MSHRVVQPDALRRLTEEVASLRTRIAANPRDALLRVRLAELLEKCADDAGSVQEYRNAAGLFMKQGQFRKARAVYQTILHRLPTDVHARRGFDAAEAKCLAAAAPQDAPLERLTAVEPEPTPTPRIPIPHDAALAVRPSSHPSEAPTVPPPARAASEITDPELFPLPDQVRPDDPLTEAPSARPGEPPQITASVIRFAESDRRDTPRVPWMVDVDVFVGTKRFPGRCRDLSMNGLYVAGPFLNAGQEVQLAFHVPGGDWVSMGAGRVTRCGARGEDAGVGIRLDEVDKQTREHMITRIAHALGYGGGPGDPSGERSSGEISR